MKRLLSALVVLCLGVSAWATTVTANLKNLTASNVTSGAYFQFTLKASNGNPVRVQGQSWIATDPIIARPDGSGNISITLEGNDVLTSYSVNDTYYLVEVYSQGKKIYGAPFKITGASVDLDTATPMSLTPPTGVSAWFVPIPGGTMTGPLILSGDPTLPLGAATKRYVDTNISAVNDSVTVAIGNMVRKTGDTMTGPLVLSGDPQSALEAATKQYADSVAGSLPNAVLISGSTMTGPLTLSGDPTTPNQAATKHYVDSVVPGGSNATQIQGVTVDTASPTDLQVLQYVAGTGKYTPSTISVGSSAPPMNLKWATTDKNWIQFPAVTLTAGVQATVTLTPCPAGIDGRDTIGWIGITGDANPEPVQLQGSGSCTPGLSSGTIKFTPAFSHTIGYGLGSGSSGIYETMASGVNKTGIGGVGNVSIVTGPAGDGVANGNIAYAYRVMAPIVIPANGLNWDARGTVLVCTTRDTCVDATHFLAFKVQGLRVTSDLDIAGWGIQSTACDLSTGIATITTSTPHDIRVGDIVDVQRTDDSYYWGGSVSRRTRVSAVTSNTVSYPTISTAHCGNVDRPTQNTPGAINVLNAAMLFDQTGSRLTDMDLSRPGNGTTQVHGHFNNGYVVLNDEAWKLDGFLAGPLKNPVPGTTCATPDSYCGWEIYAPGPFSIGPSVLWISNADLSMNCSGNGIGAFNGNTVNLDGVIVQGSSLQDISTGVRRGGFGNTTIKSGYIEQGSCFAGDSDPGSSGLTVVGRGVSWEGGEGPQGVVPKFATGGSSTYYYKLIATDSVEGDSVPMPFGTASPTSSTFDVWFPRVSQDDPLASTISYKILRSTSPDNPATSACQGGSPSACGLVNGGVSIPQCSGLWCHFTDDITQSTSSATVAQCGGWSPLPAYWPGPTVLMGGATFNYSNILLGTPGLSLDGRCTPQTFTPGPSTAGTGSWLLTLDGNAGATILDDRQASSAQNTDLTGRIGIAAPLNVNAVRRGQLFTFVDSDPASTMAESIRRRLGLPTDVYIGTEGSSSDLLHAGMASNSPVSIRNYIGTGSPDGQSWKESLTGSLKEFRVPVTFNQPITTPLGCIGCGPITQSGLQVSDNFNRSDGTLGANWTVIDGSWKISGNHAVFDAVSGSFARAYYSGGSFPSDQYAQATLNPGGNFIGICVRESSSLPFNGYCVETGSNQTYVMRWINGTNTVMMGTGTQLAAGSVVKLSAVGSSISVTVNGAAYFNGTDTNVTSGFPGVIGANATLVSNVDDFVAGDSSWTGSVKSIQFAGGPASEQPVCSAANRGLYWTVRSPAGTADTTQVCLKTSTETYSWVGGGGGGTSSPLTTKGDIWGFSSNNGRIPVGVDGACFVADSTQPFGVKWGSCAAGSTTAWGSIVGNLSDQLDLQTALNLKASLASPALTGTPTGPTAAPLTNTTQLATTAFVMSNAYNSIQSGGADQIKRTTINFVNGLSASDVSAKTQVAPVYGTTANTVAQGNDSRILGAEQTANKGAASGYAALDGTTHVPLAQIPALPESQITNLVSDLALKAPLASPALTGTPTAPTVSLSDSSTKIATTAWVKGQNYGAGGGSSSFAALTGQPTDNAALATELNLRALDGSVMHTTGAETVGGAKTFSSDVHIMGNTIFDGTITWPGPLYFITDPAASNFTAVPSQTQFGVDTNGKLLVSENGGTPAEVAKVNSNITGTASGISGSPTASQYYGTNASAVKGFYNLPAGGGGFNDPGGTGLLIQTGAATVINRALNGTANEINIANNVGTSGNPTFSIASAFNLTGKTSTAPFKSGTLASIPGTCTALVDFYNATDQATNKVRRCNAAGNGWDTVDQVVPAASVINPLINGTAAPGVATAYAREDHVHPTDTTRAADSATVHNTGNETIAGTKTFSSSIVGNITGTAPALAANGSNCGSGSLPAGVDASGAAEGCSTVADLTTFDYVVGGGTAQAQTATLSPAASALTAGLFIKWKPNAANTAAAPTLAVNGLTAKNITKCGTTALIANDLLTTAVAYAIYDGTQFQLLNPQAAACGTAASNGLTAAAILTSGNLVQAAGNDRTTVDSGVPTANVVTAASSFANGGLVKAAGANKTLASADLTGDVTTAGGVATTIANNAVTATKSAVVMTRRVCDMVFGDTSASSALTNAQLGPQKRLCYIPFAATVVEVAVAGDAGTPNIIVGRNRAGTTTNLLSSALATAAAGGIACSNAGGTTGLDGATTCSATLQNTGVNAGDYFEAVSGTAGGTAKLMTVHIVYTVN